MVLKNTLYYYEKNNVKLNTIPTNCNITFHILRCYIQHQKVEWEREKKYNHLEPNPKSLAKKFLFFPRGAASGVGAASGAAAGGSLCLAARDVDIY